MDGAWHPLGQGAAHAFDVGIAFSDADVDHLTDMLMFEGAARRAPPRAGRPAVLLRSPLLTRARACPCSRRT
jgi:hypothetical protein